MDNKEKRFTTSKVWLFITGLLFVLIILAVFCLMTTSDTILDTSIYVTAITVSGGIFGSNLCWYSKKAGSENQYKLRISMYETAVDKRLYYNEEMLKLREKYGVSQEELNQIDYDGDMDDFSSDELSGAKNKLDQFRDETETPDELQIF